MIDSFRQNKYSRFTEVNISFNTKILIWLYYFRVQWAVYNSLAELNPVISVTFSNFMITDGLLTIQGVDPG